MSGGRRMRTRRKSGWDLRLGRGDILRHHDYFLIRVGRSVLRFGDPGSVRGYGDEIVLVGRIAGSLILMVRYYILVRIAGK